MSCICIVVATRRLELSESRLPVIESNAVCEEGAPLHRTCPSRACRRLSPASSLCRFELELQLSSGKQPNTSTQIRYCSPPQAVSSTTSKRSPARSSELIIGCCMDGSSCEPGPFAPRRLPKLPSWPHLILPSSVCCHNTSSHLTTSSISPSILRQPA